MLAPYDVEWQDYQETMDRKGRRRQPSYFDLRYSTDICLDKLKKTKKTSRTAELRDGMKPGPLEYKLNREVFSET